MTTDAPSPERVEVEQVDREAAAELLGYSVGDTHWLVSAFARHRIATAQASAAEIAEWKEACATQKAAKEGWMRQAFAQDKAKQAAEAEIARLREALERAQVADWCWDYDDSEQPFDHPLEWIKDLAPWPNDEAFVRRFSWAARLPDTYELFIPPADDDGEWQNRSFSTEVEAEAARAALAAGTSQEVGR